MVSLVIPLLFSMDFWTDLHCREQFGALVADITARGYRIGDG